MRDLEDLSHRLAGCYPLQDPGERTLHQQGRLHHPGLNIEDKKEPLGIYLSDQEEAHNWLRVLTALHNRGVKDILIACVDGLKGFPGAIESIYPDAGSGTASSTRSTIR